MTESVICPGSGRPMHPSRLAYTVACPSCGRYQRVKKDGSLVSHRVVKR